MERAFDAFAILNMIRDLSSKVARY